MTALYLDHYISSFLIRDKTSQHITQVETNLLIRLLSNLLLIVFFYVVALRFCLY